MVEISGYSERTVQYALADLEAAGYIASTPVRAGTTYRRFLAPVETSAVEALTKPGGYALVEASAPDSCPPTIGAAPVETSAVERTVHQLAEQIATRREVGLAVMQ